ncbi:hypothetical protein K435DRAFT_837035 [Dendrothele bispora CBS 962.96]|uniref:Uncharacterized protein n=1 Tax=Dendrothele bispora (strain CBS 962.96) TaxID=1314807 RepID=A0A4S8MEB2_DENBC|nr:hypothetical protein K435DRAFT_837035 [Dendrothele bispora CBS 962.96]
MAPQVPSPISRNSHQASVIDVPDEEEPGAQISTPNTMPPDGPRSTAQTMVSSLLHYRRSFVPIASRVGIGGAYVPAPTPTGSSITAHNVNILRTVSTNANSSSPSITQNNLQFETLQMFNNSSHNTFTNPTITNPARDSNSYSYSFHGPVNVHPELINWQTILRTWAALQGLESTPPVPFSALQGSVSPRPRIDADALGRGDRPEAPTMGTNWNSRFRRFVSWGVSRIQDTNDLIGPSNSFFFFGD